MCLNSEETKGGWVGGGGSRLISTPLPLWPRITLCVRIERTTGGGEVGLDVPD